MEKKKMKKEEERKYATKNNVWIVGSIDWSINRSINLSNLSNETSAMASSLVWHSFGNGSYASIEERFVLPGNRGDFSQKDIVNGSRRSYGRMMV